MKTHRHTFTVALLVVAAAAVTGCTTGAGDGSGPGSSDKAASTTPAPDGASPLTAYLNSLYGIADTPDEQAQRMTAQRIEQEELTAACMKEEGFDYTPREIDAESVAQHSGPTDEDLESRDWVAQFGYGSIEIPEGRTAELYTTEKPDKGAADPNRGYVDSLTPSEKTAYNTALGGPAVDDTDDDLNIFDDWQRMGCQGEASHETGERGDPLSSTAGAEVQAKIDGFYNDYATWPGLPALDEAWADCMAENGYPGFSRQGDASILMGTTIDAAREGQGPSDDELLVQERKIALADLDCREETDFRDTQRAITFAAETQFMEDNRAEFEAFAASVEQEVAR